METTFYHDTSVDRDAMKKLKSNMTLDFASAGSTRTKQDKIGAVQLASPDLQMLKLASPELERLIIQQNGMITTTPTPTQYVYPKFVTEEQEAYARGFVDALAELHRDETGENGAPLPANQSRPVDSRVAAIAPVSTATSAPMVTEPAPTYTTLGTVSIPTSAANFKTTTTLPPATAMDTSSVIPLTTHGLTSQAEGRTASPLVIQQQQAPVALSTMLPVVKEEPQIVPCLDSATPPISPINMEVQETIKLERKRARNRVAARKCRTRKLERISRLEDRVSELKNQNTDLVDSASKLREQVCELKKQIMTHVQSGCQVMLSQNLL